VFAGLLDKGIARTTDEDIRKNYLRSLWMSKDRDSLKPRMPPSSGSALIFVSALNGTKLI